MDGVFYLFGKEIPIYGVCFYVGVLLSAVVGILLAKRNKIDIFDFIGCSIYVLIGALLGAKLLFVIVSLREIIRLGLSFWDVLRGGFVFYGGLLGGALGGWIYTKQFKLDLYPYFNIFATVLPLGHAIGRVGCFFAGCCYGIEYHGIGAHVYEKSLSLYTPLHTPLLPIQLIEAFLLLCLFCLLLYLFLRSDIGSEKVMFCYTIGYAVLRFVLEFFRGDMERGKLIGLSTSQWISIFMLIMIIVFAFIKRKN